MEHPDEGTIHAWLDQQLDEAHAAELDAHVASCASCRAAVAEARGYMASATRILGALDDVPAGVVPPSGAADVVHMQRARRRRQRWQWLSAAAGLALMVTGGMYVLQQTGSEMNTAARSASNLSDEIAETAARERTAPPAAPAAAPARDERSDAAAPQVGNASGAASADLPQRPPAAQQDMRAGRDSAPARAPATAVPPSIQADVARTPPPPPPTAPTVRSAAAAESRVEMSAAKVQPGLRARQGLGFVAGDATTAFVGCYSTKATPAESAELGRRAALLPAILQLTDSTVGSSDSRRFVAIDPAAPGRVLRWSPLSGTTIRLVIGDSSNAPVLTLMTDSLVPRLPLSQLLERRACPQE